MEVSQYTNDLDNIIQSYMELLEVRQYTIYGTVRGETILQ